MPHLRFLKCCVFAFIGLNNVIEHERTVIVGNLGYDENTVVDLRPAEQQPPSDCFSN